MMCLPTSRPGFTASPHSHLQAASVSPRGLKQRGAQGCEGRQLPPPTPPHLPGVQRLDEITSVRCRGRGRGVGWAQPAAARPPPPDPAALRADSGPSAARGVNLGTEECKCPRTGLRRSNCHHESTSRGPKAGLGRGQRPEGPEAPAAPSSGLSPRLREWQGRAQGEGGRVALAPHLMAATPQRPRGSLPGPPTLSGHHCCWPEPYVGSRHHWPPPRMLLGEGTALTPWVSPDRGPSQAPETPRHSHGATQPPSPTLRITYPAGPLPQSPPRSPGLQRHPRCEHGRHQRPRAPQAPQAHVRLWGGKHLSGLAELLKDELCRPLEPPAGCAGRSWGRRAPGPPPVTQTYGIVIAGGSSPRSPHRPGAGRARPQGASLWAGPGPSPTPHSIYNHH